jgi:F420-dependent methylenetetrahydromethanopterin dehydrogenase
MEKNSRVAVTEDVVSCGLDGEAAILNLKDGIYGLNPVGARIWRLVQETLDRIIEVILDGYDVEAEQCLQDTVELLEELQDKRLATIDG